MSNATSNATSNGTRNATTMISLSSEEEDQDSSSSNKDVDVCYTTGSLNQIGFQMANFSSPPGSSSYNKTLLVLQSASHFHINLNDKIFTGVAQNVATMLKGFGLQQNTNIYVNLTDISGVGSDVIMIENSLK